MSDESLGNESREEGLHGLSELRVDTGNLYREETYTDLKVATIRHLVPVRADGTRDDSRQPLYSAQTTLMSQAGPLPVEAPIQAASLEEAAQKFPAAIQEAVNHLVEEARELRRREASRIVVPTAMPPGGAPGSGRGSGGMSGGGGGGIIGGGGIL